MTSLLVDTHEPIEIMELLGQSCDVEYAHLNQYGNADYLWADILGNVRQIERKQWGELLGSMDHVEQQLRGEIALADQTDLLVEGMVNCSEYGLDAFVWRKSGRYGEYRYSHSFGDYKHPQQGLFSKVWAWFWQLNCMGVNVWLTPSYEGTAKAIAAFFANSQKLEHSTLNRYMKPKPELRELSPQVSTLLGIAGAQLGPARAEALIARFGSVWNVINADMKELASCPNMGKTTAKKLLNAIGREV